MQQGSSPAVYLLASKRNGTLYVGVTSDLLGRIDQHRRDLLPGFTNDYGVKRLVWFEEHESLAAAAQRERRIKEWKRLWKIELIEKDNPHWIDLYPCLSA